MFDNVESAFFFRLARPAPGALIAIAVNGFGAWPTADARIAPIVQRIVRHLVRQDELPYIRFGPMQQRIDFYQPKLRVGLHYRGDFTMLSLIATNGADPSVVAQNRPLQRQDFAVVTTLVGANRVEWPAVLAFIFGRRELRPNKLNLDPIPAQDAIPHFKRFAELVAGIEIEDTNVWLNLRNHVNDATTLSPKGRSHRQAWIKAHN